MMRGIPLKIGSIFRVGRFFQGVGGGREKKFSESAGNGSVGSWGFENMFLGVIFPNFKPRGVAGCESRF